MVFFNCNACGESLKKNQVEKHYTTKCRRCEVLSCVDCGKEFWGDSYASHIKCISEEEKYSGKNYVPKINKGEAKQEQWIQDKAIRQKCVFFSLRVKGFQNLVRLTPFLLNLQEECTLRWFEKVQAAIQKAPANPGLKNLLQHLEEFPNIPRKKAKFENFLKCSLRVHNSSLINQVWDLLMTEAEQNGAGGVSSNGVHKAVSKEVMPDMLDSDQTQQEDTFSEILDSGKELNKRERKEERRKKAQKKEKKDKLNEDHIKKDGEQETVGKKGKRRKREEEDEDEEGSKTDCQPKKKLKETKEDGNPNERLHDSAETDGEEHETDRRNATAKKQKFNWTSTIVAVLKAKGELSLKKLRKKVLAEYAAQAAGSKPEEQLLAKFNKKILKTPQVKVFKDRAKLRES